MKILTRLFALMLTLSLVACGFHLRGQNAFEMPFKSIYINSPNTAFITELKRAIRFSNVKVVDTPDKADLTLQVISEVTDKQILSLSGAGRVQEYRLLYRISLRATDRDGQDWLTPEDISLQRDYSYDNTQVLAKEQEEAQLYKNMRNDAVQQTLRRLNHAHPQE